MSLLGIRKGRAWALSLSMAVLGSVLALAPGCGGGGGNSQPANQAPTITTQPADKTVTAGATATFTVAASGTPAPSYQWQRSNDGGTTWANVTNGSGGTAASYTTAATLAGDHGAKFHAVATNSAGTATTNPVTLTVNSGPAFTTQPTAQTVNAGQTATFTVAASGNPAPTYQWQRSTDSGTTWADVTTGSGGTTASYTTAASVAGDNGAKFQAKAVNSVSTATSEVATLAVQLPSLPNILDFATDKVMVPVGGAVTLRWNVELATTIRIDPLGQEVSASGSLVVQPSQDTEYVLTAYNGAGSSTTRALVRVQKPALGLGVSIDVASLPEGDLAGYEIQSSRGSLQAAPSQTLDSDPNDMLFLTKNDVPFLKARVFPGMTSVLVNAESTALAYVLEDPGLGGVAIADLQSLLAPIMAHAKFPELVQRVASQIVGGEPSPLDRWLTSTWDELSAQIVADVKIVQPVQSRFGKFAAPGAAASVIDVLGGKGRMTVDQNQQNLTFNSSFQIFYCATAGTDASRFDVIRPAEGRIGFTADWVNYSLSAEEKFEKSVADLATIGVQGRGEEVVRITRGTAADWTNFMTAEGYAWWMNNFQGFSLLTQDLIPNLGASGKAKTVGAKLSRPIAKFVDATKNAREKVTQGYYAAYSLTLLADVVGQNMDWPELSGRSRQAGQLVDITYKAISSIWPSDIADLGRNGLRGKVFSVSKMFSEFIGKPLLAQEEEAIRKELASAVRTLKMEGRSQAIKDAVFKTWQHYVAELDGAEVAIEVSSLEDAFLAAPRLSLAVGKSLLQDEEFCQGLVDLGLASGTKYLKNLSNTALRRINLAGLTWNIGNKAIPWIADMVDAPQGMAVILMDGKPIEAKPPTVSFEVSDSTGTVLAYYSGGIAPKVKVRRGERLYFKIRAATPGVLGSDGTDLAHQTMQTIFLTELKPRITMHSANISLLADPARAIGQSVSVPFGASLVVEKEQFKDFTFTHDVRDELGARESVYTDQTLPGQAGGLNANGTYNLIAYDFSAVINQPLRAIKMRFYNYGFSSQNLLTIPIEVSENQPPVASFTATVNEDGWVDFDASASSDLEARIFQYDWTFGDADSSTGRLGGIASHRYMPGTYTVALTVMDDMGITATITKTIRVEARKPTIYAFRPDSASLQPGQSTTLRWSADEFTSLSIDNGVGDVTGRTSIPVSPAVTTTYTLTATNGAGPVSAQATVTLGGIGTGAFTSTGSMAGPRADHASTLLPNGKVLLATGLGPFDYFSARAELYDSSTGLCTPTGSLGQGRFYSTATLLPNGKVLISGGRFLAYFFTSAELYDTVTGLFTPTGSMTLARNLHTSTLLPNGKVLVTGGDDGANQSATAELYDPATGLFTATGSMAVPRNLHTATLLPNGKVLITGGSFDPGRAELYDPATGLFTSTGSMTVSSYYHTATLLPNGKVLVVGGISGPIRTATAELYDPFTGLFTPTGSMAVGREGHAATLLPNGKVLVAGGNDGVNSLVTAELYHPATGLFTSTGSMAVARERHAATLLPNGQVLVTGGYANGYLANAELFDPGDSRKTFTLPGNVPLEMITLSGGPFTMGSNDSQDYYAAPPHQVTISPFHMAKFETTQAQWLALMPSNPSNFTGDLSRPVEQVSYLDITQAGGFLEQLNAATTATRPAGLVFRLPTEAEWEYACRAGSTTAYSFGDDAGQLGNYAWYSGNNTPYGTKPVGQKTPNAFGLFDIHGNVWEWNQDWWGPYTSAAQTDPAGPAIGAYRLFRGGSWADADVSLRSAARWHDGPEGRHPAIGFRVVLALPRTP